MQIRITESWPAGRTIGLSISLSLDDREILIHFLLHGISHRVSQYLITICVKLGYIEKTKGTRYRWVKGLPSKRHLSRIKQEFESMQKPKKRVVKLLWGLIIYEV